MSAVAMEVVPRGMPKVLADKGWELLKSTTTPERFRARNEGCVLGPYPTIDETVNAAHDQQSEDDEAKAIHEEANSIDEAESLARSDAEADAAIAEEPPPRRDFEPYSTILAVDTVDPGVALSMREGGLNMLQLAEYTEAMRAGSQFPAADVFFDSQVNKYYLAGGAHRHQSTIDAGLTEFSCTVHSGSERDARIWAAGENKTHGLPRTNADKRLAVTALLSDKEWVVEADSVIAAHAGVSQPFVGELRKELESQNVISPQAKRRGKDKVMRDVTHIGGHAEEIESRQTTLADIDGVKLPPREDEGKKGNGEEGNTEPGAVATGSNQGP